MLRPEDCAPGTLNECINAARVPELRERIIYQIERFSPRLLAKDGAIHPGVFLIGVHFMVRRNYLSLPVRSGYFLYRFRLLPDERLDIFRQMLAPLPQKELV